MDNQKSSRIEQMLDLLIEEIEERLGGAMRAREAVAEELPPAGVEQIPTSADTDADLPAESLIEPEIEPEPEGIEEAEYEEMAPVGSGPSHAARMMGRLAFGLLIAVVLINIPFDSHGTTLATAMPDEASLIIRDGLAVKEESDERIFVYQDDVFRWISSLEAFDHYGFTWGDVHVVPDGYLDRHEIGSPLYVLLKCSESPHIYRSEGGEKRWIRDIDAFIAEGHVWEDVLFVSCEHLREMPDGETIPPDSGPPPQP